MVSKKVDHSYGLKKKWTTLTGSRKEVHGYNIQKAYCELMVQKKREPCLWFWKNRTTIPRSPKKQDRAHKYTSTAIAYGLTWKGAIGSIKRGHVLSYKTIALKLRKCIPNVTVELLLYGAPKIPQHGSRWNKRTLFKLPWEAERF